MIRTLFIVVLMAALASGVDFQPSTVLAEVVRIEVVRREPFAAGHVFARSGAYEKLTGTLQLEVEPAHVANERVVDLKLAPRNSRGRVEFSTDFCLLTPKDPSRGNRRLLYDVNNRGNKLALGAFNEHGGNDPSTLADAGNGFLMREGYSVLWSGWNGDVLAGDDRLQIRLPIAQQPDGQPISGKIYAEICVDHPTFSQPLAWGNTDPYPSLSLDNRSATLTARALRSQPAELVPYEEWAFARWEQDRPVPNGKHLYLKQGFKPGWIYELVYTAADPRVTGLGLAAVRDVASFFRYGSASERNPVAGGIERAYVFGISQSARFIHQFLYEDFNGDEAGRIVFDGAMPHVGGAGKGLFNCRFAQTTRHGSPVQDNLYPSERFPMATTASVDPLTGERGDLLELPRRAGHLPKIMFTETSTEYWCRAASLLHTDVEAKRDVELDPCARLYFIAGGQHGNSASTAKGINENPGNTLDHRAPLRALLVALDRWVSEGQEPPASRYPHISDGTLVDLATWRAAFPKIPGVALPESTYMPLRLDLGSRWSSEGIADELPPLARAPYKVLVPAVDADGNEIAGIHLPDVAVPLATYSGWNRRAEAYGAGGMLARLSGSRWPLARTTLERQQTGDPRLSVQQRYPSDEVYLARMTEAVLKLRAERFLLDEDAVRLLSAHRTRMLAEPSKN
jgi:hypothetical protein